MEQPIKDLQYFKDQVAKENRYISWEECINDQPAYLVEKFTDQAAERYASYREQKAREEAFIEGAEAQRLECAKTGNPYITLAVNPYGKKEMQI